MSKRKKRGERPPASRRPKQNDRAGATGGPTGAGTSYSAMARRIRGLLRLFEARLEAIDARRSVWDFAVEIGALRDAAGLTNPDLQWLVAEGLVEFAVETTRGGSAKRSFRHGERLSLSDHTVFVIGERVAGLLAGWCDALVGGTPLTSVSAAGPSTCGAVVPDWNPGDGRAPSRRWAGEVRF